MRLNRWLQDGSLAGALAIGLTVALPVRADFTLEVLHNNDGESKLEALSRDDRVFGGAARFVAAINEIRAAAEHPTVTLSSGDNILPGPAFDAALASGTLFDALVLAAIGYDAIAVGNHDLDFGPDILADVIEAFPADAQPPYLSANLDFTGEPRLQTLVESGRIAASVVVERDGVPIGIIGATTEALPVISSPGAIAVAPALPAIQAEINRLKSEAGVRHFILVSHLQNIRNELDQVAPNLTDIDIIIAGGGSEFLTNSGPDPLNDRPDDVFGAYPLMAVNADGDPVAVVTTPGNYRYLGQLTARFDDSGRLVEASGDTVLIDSDRYAEDSDILASVLAPVTAHTDALAAQVLASSTVPLDGRRASVRSISTNLGTLTADAMVYAARSDAAKANPVLGGNSVIGLQNGGGIRNDDVLPPGDVTALNTFEILPFANFVAVFDVSAADLVALLEHGLIRVGGGQFPQLSRNVRLTVDLEAPLGERVRALAVDGVDLYDAETGMLSDRDVTVVTNDFLARGGDAYPIPSEAFIYRTVTTYQQALASFLTEPEGLGGTIDAAAYPDLPDGPIVPAR